MKGRGRIDRPSLMNSPGSGGLALRALVPMLLAVLITGAGVGAAAAQTVPPPGVRVSFTADRSELTVGDLVTLSLVVAHPADLVVVVPRVGREWGPFEVQAQTSVQTVSDNDVVRTVAKQFRVTAFAPGALETPALPVYIRAPDGSVRQVHANPVRVTVNSVLAGPDEQLKDLRSPADFRRHFGSSRSSSPWPRWLCWLRRRGITSTAVPTGWIQRPRQWSTPGVPGKLQCRNSTASTVSTCREVAT